MENLRLTYREAFAASEAAMYAQPSTTIPGQDLVPADLMKRHLAGTLPDIDLSDRYEYHYDENGEQISEPLPLEMHELHNLAVAIRKREFEEATKHRAAEALKFKQQIIDEYKSNLAKDELQNTAVPASTPPDTK